MHFLIGFALVCLIILMIAANPKAFGYAALFLLMTCGGCVAYLMQHPEGWQK